MTSVAVFWDIENCAPPKNIRGSLVEEKLRKYLTGLGPIKQISAYAQMKDFPHELKQELQHSGVHLIDAPHLSEKDVVDHMIITDMYLFAMNNAHPQKIVLISGDIDYAYPLARLRQHQYEIILVIPPVGANRMLIEQADVILEWNDIMGRSGSASKTGFEGQRMRFEFLRSILEEMEQDGMTPAKDLSEIEIRLDAKYPTWKQTTKFDSIEEYYAAYEKVWASTTAQDSLENSDIDEEDVHEEVDPDRYSPLITVLHQAESQGTREPELAWIGIALRSLMDDPLRYLGIKRLKDYVLEAQEYGIVKVRQDGLQHYVSLIHKAEREKPSSLDDTDLDLLEQALESLRQDEVIPTSKAVLGRMRELGDGWIVSKSSYGSLRHLLDVAKDQRGIIIETSHSFQLIFPKSGKFDYWDPNDSDNDPFSNEEWVAFEDFLKAHSDLRVKGRYGLAKMVKDQCEVLSSLSLGKLTVLVQLAINKGWLTFYQDKLGLSPIYK
ncbi:MAG: NYN domain-containing protein [Candidatus Thorarchaeota archaeon]|nr:NYN domain-containing protein [Candidatus Thorarchaeota archaeon]